MVPFLFGDHCRHTCDDCRFEFFIRAEAGEDGQPSKLVCPNCGFVSNDAQTLECLVPAEVDILPRAIPTRWEIVAFELPEKNSIGIKRVIGLPNESIEIHDGDLFADDKRLVKDWLTQKQIRILVHDSKFEPLSDMPERWQPDQIDAEWSRDRTGMRFKQKPKQHSIVQHGDTGDSGSENWLNYQHWRCCSHSQPRTQIFPIEDYYAFNQTLARKLNPVCDLCLEAEIHVDSDSRFTLNHRWGPRQIDLRFDTAENTVSVEVHSSSHESKSGVVKLEGGRTRDQIRLAVSTIDAQLLLVIDDQVVYSRPIAPIPMSATWKSGQAIWRWHGEQGDFRINRIRLWRDIFYYPVSDSTSRMLAGPTGYVLLGDNVPVSIDSRHWRPASVDQTRILGTVKLK